MLKIDQSELKPSMMTANDIRKKAGELQAAQKRKFNDVVRAKISNIQQTILRSVQSNPFVPCVEVDIPNADSDVVGVSSLVVKVLEENGYNVKKKTPSPLSSLYIISWAESESNN